jgi:hypothetical protein
MLAGERRIADVFPLTTDDRDDIDFGIAIARALKGDAAAIRRPGRVGIVGRVIGERIRLAPSRSMA